MLQQKRKREQHRPTSSNINSYMNYENISVSDSGSLTSSSDTLLSAGQSSNSSNTSISQVSEKSISKSEVLPRKKSERSRLKVSINETAELIEDQEKDEKLPITSV